LFRTKVQLFILRIKGWKREIFYSNLTSNEYFFGIFVNQWFPRYQNGWFPWSPICCWRVKSKFILNFFQKFLSIQTSVFHKLPQNILLLKWTLSLHNSKFVCSNDSWNFYRVSFRFFSLSLSLSLSLFHSHLSYCPTCGKCFSTIDFPLYSQSIVFLANKS